MSDYDTNDSGCGSGNTHGSGSKEIPTVLMQPFAHSCQKASTDSVVFDGASSEAERHSPWLIIGF